MYPIMGYNSVYADIYFNIERKAITMAIRTASTTARSSSHSTQSAPKKPSSAQRSGSASRSSAQTQSKQTSSASRRDTFTCSASAAKQAPSKTSAAKTSTVSKSSQAKTSAAKPNTTAKASSSKTAAKTKSAQTASKTKRDSFEFSSEAVKKSVQSAKNSKSSANSKAATKSSAQNSANAQTKKTAKNNSSNKASTSGNASKSKATSSQEKMLESIKKAYAHTKDPKQRAAMRKTMNDISREISSKKAEKANKTNKTNKTTDLLVKYDRSNIKSQFEYYLGDRACYATSADNMWRVNDGAVGDKIINLADDHKDDGVITGAPCDDDYIYISDSGKVFKTDGQNVVKKYYGKDENEKEYTAVRIQGLSKDDYTELVLQELNKDKIVCVRVVNNVGDDPINGHTMNIVGTNSQGEFLYENCGRYPTPLSTLKPATLADTGYTNSKEVKRQYFEVQEGQYEIWIDTTK